MKLHILNRWKLSPDQISINKNLDVETQKQLSSAETTSFKNDVGYYKKKIQEIPLGVLDYGNTFKTLEKLHREKLTKKIKEVKTRNLHEQSKVLSEVFNSYGKNVPSKMVNGLLSEAMQTKNIFVIPTILKNKYALEKIHEKTWNNFIFWFRRKFKSDLKHKDKLNTQNIINILEEKIANIEKVKKQPQPGVFRKALSRAYSFITKPFYKKQKESSEDRKNKLTERLENALKNNNRKTLLNLLNKQVEEYFSETNEHHQESF